MSPLCSIILVIVFGGLIGGTRNYFKETDSPSSRWGSIFVPRMLEALIASATVPLFLSLIGNNITDTILLGGDGTEYALLKLAGFCLLAALYSNRFLDSISSKVFELEEQTKKNELSIEQLNTVVIESDADEPLSLETGGISETEKMVIDAFASTNIPARSFHGLQATTQLSTDELQAVLESLLEKKQVHRVETSRGVRWVLATRGPAATLSPK